MDSQPFDQSGDALLAFASEAAVAPTPDREPAFLRTPTPYDGHLSITSIAQPPPSESVSARPLTTALVVAGVIGGFIGGYVFADRIIGPATAPAAHRAAAPAPPPAPPTAPAPVPATASASALEPAPVAAPVASSESSAPRTEPPAEPTREPNVVRAAQAADANVAPIPTPPLTTKRASTPSSTRRPTTRPIATRPGPAVTPTTALSGAIEIVSRPRDAQVFLDGVLVGRAPMSIPDVSEGTHEVRVQLDGFHPWVTPVRVKGGSRARLGASLEHE